MDETRTRRQQQDNVVHLVTSSSEKRARLQRLIDERKGFEASQAQYAGDLKRGVNSTPMSPRQPGVRVANHTTSAKSEAKSSVVDSSTKSSGWVLPNRAEGGNVPSDSKAQSSKLTHKNPSTTTVNGSDVKRPVLRYKWVDGVNVKSPVESKSDTKKFPNNDGKEPARPRQSETSFLDGAGALAAKPRIAGVYNPDFTSKIHGPPRDLTSQNNAFSDTSVHGGVNTKPTRPNKVLSSPLHRPATIDEGFDVVGKAELERDDGFDRLELSTLSADNGRGELTFWEDEEDEEEWFEGWDEGGLAEPKVKAGIDGRKGREVRFMAGL